MNILNEQEFTERVKECLDSKEINHCEAKSTARQKTKLKQDVFFDLCRTHHTHIPDLMITENEKLFPLELKSPLELYNAGKYSYAHLCNFLLQTIYGQCFSYADLFRQDEAMSIYLVLPKEVTTDTHGFDDIQPVFKTVLTTNCSMFRNLMNIMSVTFNAPSFATTTRDQYGLININNIEILVTKITYIVNQQ